jgi:hypothetical protein
MPQLGLAKADPLGNMSHLRYYCVTIVTPEAQQCYYSVTPGALSRSRAFPSDARPRKVRHNNHAKQVVRNGAPFSYPVMETEKYLKSTGVRGKTSSHACALQVLLCLHHRV